MGTQALSGLSDEQIAHEILRWLWREYDVGGVSSKRALRSWLLEDALDLLPREWMPRLEECLVRELLADAARRKPEGAVTALLFGEGVDPSFLSDSTLALLLLRDLRAWYEEDAKRPDALVWEKKLLDEALRLIPAPPNLPRFAREDLIEIARSRIHKRIERQMRIDDYAIRYVPMAR